MHAAAFSQTLTMIMVMMMTMMAMMMMIIVVSRTAKFKRIVRRLDAKMGNLNAGAYSASNWEVHGGAEASNRLRVCVSVLFCMFRPLRFVRLFLFVFGMQALDEGRCHHCFARVV